MTSSTAQQACQACRWVSPQQLHGPRVREVLTRSSQAFEEEMYQGTTFVCTVCTYPDPPTSTSTPGVLNAVQDVQLSATTSKGALPIAGFRAPPTAFPLAFFLDSDFLKPVGLDALSRCPQSHMCQAVLAHIGDEPRILCEEFFSTIYPWLPIVSKKRLLYEIGSDLADVDGSQALLLLCMKLCVAEDNERPKESVTYAMAKSLCTVAESEGFISIRLVQAMVLLCLYEISHAIYPAAYTTVGRASRLGMLMGMYDRTNIQQVFKPSNTWTIREEQRRTWWAIFLFDRFMSTEISGIPFAVPDPCSNELLPVNDKDWDMGNVVANESLYTQEFSGQTVVGYFAQTCLASHLLGKVLKHKEIKKTGQWETGLLEEAMNLHLALSTIHSSLIDLSLSRDPSYTSHSAETTALAICTSARLILYDEYGCNETRGTGREPTALETEMQHIALQGVKSLALVTAPAIGRAVSGGGGGGGGGGGMRLPLVGQCLYLAATDSAWFLREDRDEAAYSALEQTVAGLRALGERWAVGREYLNLLEEGEILKLIN